MHQFLSFNATYTGIASLLAASIDLSVSQSARVDKSKVFWTVFKYFKNGSFANPEQGICGNRLIQIS
jgi:hypothetical protein